MNKRVKAILKKEQAKTGKIVSVTCDMILYKMGEFETAWLLYSDGSHQKFPSFTALEASVMGKDDDFISEVIDGK